MFDLDPQRLARPAWLGYEVAAFVTFVLFAFTNTLPVDVGAAIGATVVLVSTRALGMWSPARSDWAVVGGLAAASLLIASSGAFRWDEPPTATIVILTLPIALAAAYLAVRGRLERPAIRWIGLILLIAIVGIVAVVYIVLREAPNIDALHLHVSAADAILEGKNPYVAARSPNTNPFAPPGSEFVGYAYPPLALIAYAGSDILLGDPRWAGAIALAAAIALIMRPWSAMTRAQAAAALAIGLAVVAQPDVGSVLRQGWTDLLALPFLVGAGLLWRRNPVASAVLLGLAFGTKQYFVMALPVLLVWNDEFRWRRLLIASGVAVLTLLPAVLVDPVAFWNATIAASFDAPARPDSSGLAGVGVELPLLVVVALSFAAAVWMTHRASSPSRFLLALGGTLAVGFLFGFQAFINYWFFVGTLTALALAVAVSTGSVEVPDTIAEPAA